MEERQSMREARHRLGMRLSDLERVTRINISCLSRFERGLEAPNTSQRTLLERALGVPLILGDSRRKFERRPKMKTGTPNMPTMRWVNGKPCFDHLNDEDDRIQQDRQKRLTDAARKRIEESEDQGGVPEPLMNAWDLQDREDEERAEREEG